MNQKLYYYIKFVLYIWVCVKIIDSLYIYIRVHMRRKEKRGVKLCERPPLWVGLAEIRLNCWLREKISSVSVVGDALCTTVHSSCASLRRARYLLSRIPRCGLPSCEIMATVSISTGGCETVSTTASNERAGAAE